MSPVVTIGMPVFQNAATLARAIASVRAQSFTEWRLIITDDGSADGSQCIAAAAAHQDPRIEFLQNPERLGHMNFKVSLALAETDWFVWLAADDYWAPQFIEATFAASSNAPEAVSILPRWAYVGMDGTAPRTLPLDGSRVARVRRFLAGPGGTRMYGLTRRDVLQSAFPRRAFNAYDWYLVLGFLRAGPQIEIPSCLLYRERTSVSAYVETAADQHRGPFRWFPVLRMSLAALLDGRVPLANLGDLVRLNLRKREEYLAYLNPSRFARWIGLWRLLGLPIATTPGKAAYIAAELVKEAPDRRKGAALLLDRLARHGDAAAALSLGKFRRDGVLSGDAVHAFERARQLGDRDASFFLAQARRAELDEMAFWSAVIDAAAAGSAVAKAWLEAARASGEIPTAVAPAVRTWAFR